MGKVAMSTIERPEVILSIGEFSNEANDGFRVVTSKQTIEIGISNDQQCCESWGYFSTPDDTEYFEAATLLGINTVESDESDGYGGKFTQFVNIETDRGQLQLAVYNAHNGYYGHSIYITSNDVSYKGYI
jgi:hypothetical protein